MRILTIYNAVFAVVVFLSGFCLRPSLLASTEAEQGMVASVHPLATEAGINAMKQGGNAIDAAVATALTLGVVDGHNSGIGGGCFILIRLASGEIVAIDGREMAPAAAARDMFIRGGKADTQLSQCGALAAGIPGSLAAYAHILAKYGNLKLADLLTPAADLAERGFAIDGRFASKLEATAKDLAKFPASAKIFLKPDGHALHEGELLVQPDLARSYRSIAREGISWFYEGYFASETEAWMKVNGGILTARDFKDYQIKVRDPIITTYRGYKIASFPPPSSGGVHVAEILNILETRDLKEMGSGTPDLIHFTTEAMKLAFADRAHWLGDPDYAKVPRGLVSKEYAASLAARISMEKASKVEGHGTPDKSADDIFGKHTTHLSTADNKGNWVACTTTLNTPFGSKVTIPDTGVLLNNQMDDFSIQPGVPNSFNLIGAEANAVAPGKRPLSSMSPTIILQDGQPILALGAAGGPTIISQTLLTIVNVLDFKMDLSAALKEPRWHHQWSPNEIKIESTISEATFQSLEKRGHHLSKSEAFGACNAVGRSAGSKHLTGASDPRVPGSAKGL